MSLDRELTGIVFAINLHPAGGQVVLYKIIIIMIVTIITSMNIIVNNKFSQKGRCRSPGHPGLLANTREGLLLSPNRGLQVWR